MSTAAERVRAALKADDPVNAIEIPEVEARDHSDTCVTIEVARDRLHHALSLLKERAGFEAVSFITAVDRHPATPRFEVVHQLWAPAYGDRVRLRTRLLDDQTSVSSCTDLWSGAAFMERECFDMFGITFDGNPDMRRLLMPEGYGHHPLRKDFPHRGIDPERLYREWDQNRRGEALA